MAPASEAIRCAYEKLGRTAGEVFPFRYVSAVTLKSGPVAGTVSGFMRYRSFSERTVVEVR